MRGWKGASPFAGVACRFRPLEAAGLTYNRPITPILRVR